MDGEIKLVSQILKTDTHQKTVEKKVLEYIAQSEYLVKLGLCTCLSHDINFLLIIRNFEHSSDQGLQSSNFHW